MRFEDVTEHMWLRRAGDYWYVRSRDDIYCKLVNNERVLKLTSGDFIKEPVKHVQPPIFQLHDKVIYIGNNIFIKNQIATIHFISEDSETPYFIKAHNKFLVEAEWVNPFELVRLDY